MEPLFSVRSLLLVVTVVLDAVGVDEADVGEEGVSVLVLVFGDVLQKRETHIQRWLCSLQLL